MRAYEDCVAKSGGACKQRVARLIFSYEEALVYFSRVAEKLRNFWATSRNFSEHYGEHVVNVFGDRGATKRVWLRGVIGELLEGAGRLYGRLRRSISTVDTDCR